MRSFIFLDDTRNPDDIYVGTDWTVVRTAEEFKDYFNTVRPSDFIVSFDHDLGNGESGYDLLKWLLKNHRPTDVRFHSANWEAAKNMRAYWKSWKKVHM